ncbi:MAG: rhomboid family intramembrane serine protease [Candidatus Krumholzibacteria bacterium]|nr:rhomboid family intramembrane serine protease [Candidatus Krumholzibacteria bacterium]
MYFFYFYPLGLDRRRTRLPVLSRFLMASMVVAFLWVRYFPDQGPCSPYDLVFYPGDGSPLTALTAIFLHAGWMHLLGNLLYLHVFGPPLEDRLGHGKFLIYFLIMGVGGNLAHGLTSALDLLGQGGTGVMGASGAIAGLLAFSLVRFHDSRVEVAWWVLAPLGGHNKAGRSRIPLAAAVGFWLLLQVVQALLASETGASVSFGAHFGGFALGLVLALLMGELESGRIEALGARAERYFRDGQFHAAAGAWTEYLVRSPGDLTARLELARAQKLCRQDRESLDNFRKVFDVLLSSGRIPKALDVFNEAGRGRDGRWLPPADLAKVAYFKEKQLDYTGALNAYRQLHEAYPLHPEGQRALVRVIVLYHGKLADQRQARQWLQRAWRQMPPGSWREYLEREFRLAEEPREAVSEGSAAGHPSRES